MTFLLGADAGGTASRATLTTLDGEVRGTGTAGPGNPCAQGHLAPRAIGAAIRAAIGTHDPTEVSAAVVGVAGTSALAEPDISEAFQREWKAIGLTCPVHIVGDAVTAFAAGTTEPSGAVLIAGTGAVAALVDGLNVLRTADGHGWLLGDEGSGTWLGLQALRAAVRGEALTTEVFAAVGVTSVDALINWAGHQRPSAFAALAPLVCTSSDPGATRIIKEAVARLLNSLDQLNAPTAPVVLAGSLLTADTPIRAGVLKSLRSRGGSVGTARNPVTGAIRLAATTTGLGGATTPEEKQPTPASPPYEPSR